MICPLDMHLHGINFLSWVGYVRLIWHEMYGVWLSIDHARAIFQYFMCGGH